MKVYFIRHGESVHNAANIHQGRSSELSRQGKRQAKAAALRMKGIKAEVVVVSEYQRALQTAHIIGDCIGRSVISTSLFNEWRGPSEMVGKKHGTKLSARIYRARLAHQEDPSWHYSDEENPTDLIRRARRAIRYLSKRREKSIIVVSHGGFIHCLVGAMLFGAKFDPKLNTRFMHFLEMRNTGITVCEMTKAGEWKLITWNDSAHLA